MSREEPAASTATRAPEPPGASSRARVTVSAVTGTAVMLGIAIKGLTERLSDPDLWWHLRTGELIVAERALPAGDPYSFTKGGAPWVVQEWGSEVLMYGVRALGGLTGIIVWRALMLLAIYGVVARLILREAGPGVGSWVIVALAAFAGVTNWTERPNLFSFLLFAVLLTMVRARRHSIWWAIPLVVVWANLHGMVLLGLGTLVVVAAAEAVKVALRLEDADRDWARRLGSVSAVAIVASFLNPYGPRLLAHGLRLSREASAVVTEWASPDFHEVGNLFFLLLLVATVAGMALSPRRPDLTDVVLVAAFVVLALFAVRNLVVAGIVLGSVAARTLPGAVAHLGAARARPRSPDSIVVNTGALALVLVLFGSLSGRVAPFGDEPVSAALPSATIARLPAGDVRLLTRDDWAGFAIERRWPALRVAFDTRVDFFGPQIVRAARRALAGLPGWGDFLDSTCTTHVLVDADDGLAEAVARDDRWRRVADDPVEGGRAVLYERRTGCARAS